MTAAKRRRGSHKSPAVPDEERQAILLRGFRRDLVYWIASDPRTALRIMRLIEEVLVDPRTGVGKPERLKHQTQGAWSRRITDEHRMVYSVTSVGVYFVTARWHYER